MREVQLPILDHSQCAAQLKQTRLGSSFVLDRGFMCAGNERIYLLKYTHTIYNVN